MTSRPEPGAGELEGRTLSLTHGVMSALGHIAAERRR
jgi:hypothetical protein